MLNMNTAQENLIKRLLSQRGRVLGYIMSIVRDHHLAEDIFQDVALVVLRKADTIADDETFTGWVFRAARFEALNAYRKHHRGPQPMDDALLDLLDKHWLEQAQDEDGSEKLSAALRECMGHLTERSRELINLRYGRNLSGQDLSRHLQRPINTVYVALTRIHRALLTCVNQNLSRREAIP